MYEVWDDIKWYNIFGIPEVEEKEKGAEKKCLKR